MQYGMAKQITPISYWYFTMEATLRGEARAIFAMEQGIAV
jgi:hypothetical protein